MDPKIVLWTCIIEIPKVCADAKLSIFLPYGDNVYDPGWIFYLPNEPCFNEFIDLFFNFRYQLWMETSLGLLLWRHSPFDGQAMNNNFGIKP